MIKIDLVFLMFLLCKAGKDIHFDSRSSMTISADMRESGEPIGKPDFCLKEVPRKLNAELAEQVRSPISNYFFRKRCHTYHTKKG